MMWWIILALSISLNVFAAFYIRWLLRALVHTSDGLESVWETVDGYTEHVKTINELEMFYGDETLASLIRHGNEMTEVLNEYKLTYEIATPEDEEVYFSEEKEKE